MRTYNQIIYYVEQFSEAHLQVKSWSTGFKPDLNEFLRNNPDSFYLYVEPLSVEYNERVGNHTFRIYCIDIKQKDNNNTKDVLSDTAQILLDFRKFIIYNFQLHKLWTLEGTSSRLLPVNNYTNDLAVGWYMDIIISTNIIECDDSATNPILVPDVVPPLQFLTCETLPSCPTIISIQEDIEDIWEAIENLDVDVSWGNITGDINNQTDLIQILNDKVNITDLAPVATSGDYNDLINTPTIPTDINELTDNSGLLFDGDYNNLDNLPNLNLATFTIDLSTELTVDFYAPYDLRINSFQLIVGSDVILIKINDVPYTGLGDLINQGDKITVEAASNLVVNLNVEYE
jgi:hypothetical protein